MASIIIDSGEQKGTAVFIESGGELTIGRDESSGLPLSDTSASRTHCRVVSEGDAWLLEDLESTNGTRVNEKTITRRILNDGDVIRIGKAELVFRKSNRVAPPAATAEPAETPSSPMIDLGRPPPKAAPKLNNGPTKAPPKLNTGPAKPPPKFDLPPSKEVKVKLVPGRGRGRPNGRNGEETQPVRAKRPKRRRRR